MAHYGAAQFPALSASVGDLYGASSFRMCEAQEYALDLDALDREELALERMVQALVERKAPVPIGVKFHRASPHVSAGTAAAHSGASAMDQHGRRGLEGDEEDDEEEDDDDMEEDEMDDEDDDDEEEEDDGFPLDGRDSEEGDALDSGDDPFAQREDSLDDGDVSMDLDVEDQPRRETW